MNTNKKNNFKTGQQWSQDFQLDIIDVGEGWNDVEEFSNIPISREEFLNRCSLATLPPKKTRREAYKMKKKLEKF